MRAGVTPRATAAAAAAVRRLGGFVANLDTTAVGAPVMHRLALVVEDSLAVTLAGAATAELTALRAAWPAAPGPAALLGTATTTAVEPAIWLNGTALCCLELDEGDKYARGHPLAHVLPVALAVAAERGASGPQLRAALLAGHEVAARAGRATVLRAGTHPHGNWGALGAAAAAARLMELDGAATASAIDAAAGLVLASPFASAVAGTFVRNTWVGAAGVAGLVAARLAAAGLATVDGTAAASLGALLGTFDPVALVDDLGVRWDVELGYLKRHASCSYTHPPADAALALRAAHPDLHPASIRDVQVATHGLAAGLDRTAPPTRLAAMFSIPHVVAAALTHGDVEPVRTDAAHRAGLQPLAERVRVVRDPELDARLPAERAARVTVRLDGGRRLDAEVDNPVGDADHQPFGCAEVHAKAVRLLGAEAAAAVADTTTRLLATDDIRSIPLP